MAPSRSKPQRKARLVLITQHVEHGHPAALKRALDAQGIPSRIIRLDRGEQLPAVNEDFAGIISMGGPMGANDHDEHPWIDGECQLLHKLAHDGRPVVGICLGGQMLAKALGGRVEKNTLPEVGWFGLEMTAEGLEDPLFKLSTDCAREVRQVVYQWHHDTFHLPTGATLLARSETCPRQAFKWGERVYGLQFHPEADHQLVEEWAAHPTSDAEIEELRAAHGDAVAQTGAAQIERARELERFNLRVVAGIAQLFLVEPSPPEKSAWADYLLDAFRRESLIELSFCGTDDRSRRLRGTVVDLFTLGEFKNAVFVVLKAADTGLLWPIRLDRVAKVLLG